MCVPAQEGTCSVGQEANTKQAGETTRRRLPGNTGIMPYHKFILAHRAAVLRVQVRDQLHDFLRLMQRVQPSAYAFKTTVQKTEDETHDTLQEKERGGPANPAIRESGKHRGAAPALPPFHPSTAIHNTCKPEESLSAIHPVRLGTQKRISVQGSDANAARNSALDCKHLKPAI